MPFLKKLVGELARRAARDPRVRDTAQRVFEQEIKPRAESAWKRAKPEIEATWEKAKPEVEAAWDRAKPQVEAAKDKAFTAATDLADRVKRGVNEAAKAPDRDPPKDGDSD